MCRDALLRTLKNNQDCRVEFFRCRLSLLASGIIFEGNNRVHESNQTRSRIT